MNESYETQKKYLLGTLEPDSVERFDLQIIEDEDFAAEMYLAENNLIEDFIEQRLTPSETAEFENHFLCSDEREQLLREIQDLKKFARLGADDPSRLIVRTDDAPRKSFFGSLFRPLVLAPVLAGAVIIGFGVWQLALTPSMSPLEREYAQLNKRDLSDLNSLQQNTVVSLADGTLRDGSGVAAKKFSDLSETTVFRLLLPIGENARDGFSVRLMSGKRPDFAIADLHAYQAASGSELRVLFPKTQLEPGRYQIKVQNRAMSAPAIYNLSIE
ncbi:MAG: hypothetical protein QM785_04110 [Pyrinomonadaceae bacterium]